MKGIIAESTDKYGYLYNVAWLIILKSFYFIYSVLGNTFNTLKNHIHDVKTAKASASSIHFDVKIIHDQSPNSYLDKTTF